MIVSQVPDDLMVNPRAINNKLQSLQCDEVLEVTIVQQAIVLYN